MATRLTALGLEKIKADPSRRIEIPDGLLPGLYHVIQPTGARSWAVRYRASGKPRKFTLGGYPALPLDKAREAARAALVEAARGADPATAKQEARRAAKAENLAGLHRFENVARSFLTRYAKRKNRAWRDTARLLGLAPDKATPESAGDPMAFVTTKGGIAAKWASRHIGEIRRAEIIELLDDIADRGAPVGANRSLAALRKLFNWSIERGLIEASPCTAIKPPGPETSRDRVLSDDEIRWLWRATEIVGYPFGPVARLLLLTGQRRTEVAGMTRGEIDGAQWTIPKDRAKNDQQHVVPLSDAALETLASVPKIAGRSGFIFTTTGETSVSGWSRAKVSLDRAMLTAARKEAGDLGDDPEAVSIPPWTLHDLRRTAASGMARLGIAVHVVERLLNHRSGAIRGVAAVYNRHDYWNEREAAAQAWGKYVTNQVTGKASSDVEPPTSEAGVGNVVPMRLRPRARV